MEVCSRLSRPPKSKASDIPMRVRRRQSDARWRANVASCFETLKNIIPVNKRASKRQISKAYILQETSKHITFLEGILCTLMQEKANIDGCSEDGAYAAGFEQVKEDFIIDQRDKLAALNNERKYKRNKYKIYLSDNLPYGPNDPRAGIPQGMFNKKKPLVNPLVEASCCSPCPNDFYDHLHSSQPPVKRPRIKASKQQPTVRVIVRPPKRLKDEQPPVENCQIKKIPITKINPTVPRFRTNQAPFSTISTRPNITSPKTPSRRKQKVPHKRPASSKPKKENKKKKAKLSMTAINPVCTGCVGGGPGRSPTVLRLPYNQYQLHGFSQQMGNQGVEATQRFVEQPEEEPLLEGIGHLEEVLEEVLGEVLEEQPVRYQDQAVYKQQQEEVTQDVVTEPQQPLDLTPAKSHPSSTDPHSTPKEANHGHHLPLLLLSPLHEEADPMDNRSIECTPVKIQQTDEEKKVFTPVTLPKDWMTTPLGRSPGTPKDMSTPALQISYEQRRLDCDEDISSEDEETNTGAKSPPAQSQAFQHRSRKLQGSLQCPDSGPCEKRKKAVSKRHENMKCRRSLNMSLDIEESHNTGDTTGFDTTEACIQDFDRYYQKLRDSKSEEPSAEVSVKMDPVWELLQDTESPGVSAHKDEGYQVPEEYYLTDHLDINATDEYLPIEEYEALGCIPVNDEVWQVVPKSECSMWSDSLDIQLVPTDLAGNMIKGEHEGNVQEGSGQASTLDVENQLVPQYGYDAEEGFHPADVLTFIRQQLLSEGVEVPDFISLPTGDDAAVNDDNVTHVPPDKNHLAVIEYQDEMNGADDGQPRCSDGPFPRPYEYLSQEEVHSECGLLNRPPDGLGLKCN